MGRIGNAWRALRGAPTKQAGGPPIGPNPTVFLAELIASRGRPEVDPSRASTPEAHYRTSPVFFRSANVVADIFASLPWRLAGREPKTPAPTTVQARKALRFLNEPRGPVRGPGIPGDVGDTYSQRKRLALGIMLRGQSYTALLFREARGARLDAPPPDVEPWGYQVLHAHRVTPLVGRNDLLQLATGYDYRVPGGNVITLHPARVVPTVDFSTDSYHVGTGAGEVLDLALSSIQAATEWNRAGFLSGGSHLRWIIDVAGELGGNTELREKIARDFEDRYLSSATPRGTVVNDASAKAHPAGATHQDMEWSDLLMKLWTEVTSATGVPATFAGLIGTENYATMELQYRALAELTLLPLIRLIESSWTEHVVRRFTPDARLDVDTTDVRVLREDFTRWIENMVRMVQTGMLTEEAGLRILIGLGLGVKPTDLPDDETRRERRQSAGGADRSGGAEQTLTPAEGPGTDEDADETRGFIGIVGGAK